MGQLIACDRRSYEGKALLWCRHLTMASLQITARPVACRAHAATLRSAQAPRARPALRRSVLVRADPKVGKPEMCGQICSVKTAWICDNLAL